jgi:plasmid maintenance system antidote protein VapI
MKDSYSLSGRLKDAIEAHPQNRHHIAQHTRIADSALSRFVRGERSLSLESADRLAAYLGLELLPSQSVKRG